MRNFPHDHPYFTRAQVDLERPDAAACAELKGEGALASLEAGDGLFIPCHWWHHIHSCDENDVSISLNFWFDPSREMHEVLQRDGALPFPPPKEIHANVAREIEAFVHSSVAPHCPDRARFFEGLLLQV